MSGVYEDGPLGPGEDGQGQEGRSSGGGDRPRSLGAMSLSISQYYYHAHLAPELITLDLKL